TIGQNIYVLGGGAGFFNNIKYDPTINTWTQIAGSPNGLVDGGAATIDGKIYMVSAPPLNGAVQIYDPQTNNWTTGATMPSQRDGFVVAAANKKLYVLGGML